MTPAQHKQVRNQLVAKLRKERERRGLSRVAVMERGGPTPNCTRNIEKGDSGPSLITYIAYAEALDLEVFLGKRVPILGKVR